MTANRPERILPALLLVALSALAFVSMRAPAMEAEDRKPPAVPPATEAPAVLTAAESCPQPGAVTRTEVAPPKGHEGELALPDGTFVKPLNGAVDPQPLEQFWGAWPWSPIVGVERSSVGVDWYRHADGSYSTTQRLWRSDTKEWVTATRVAHPGPETPSVAK
jgi:hypothetical protein